MGVRDSKLFQMFVPNSVNKNLKPQISSIDQNGLVTIDFGEEIIIPKAAKNFTNAIFSLGIVDENFMRMLAYTNSNRSNEKPSNSSLNNYTKAVIDYINSQNNISSKGGRLLQ